MAPRFRLTALLVAAGIVLTGCAADGGDHTVDGRPVTVGAQSGLTNEVVAQLYGQVLEDVGYEVAYNYGIGGRTAFVEALEDGSLDLVADYGGLLLSQVDPESRASSTSDVMAALPVALEPLGLTVLQEAPAQRSRSFVTTREFAAAHDLRSLDDLAPIASAITIGSTERLDSEPYGRDALAFSYGVDGWLARTAKTDDEVIHDLVVGNIQVADVSTLETAIDDEDLVVLDDPAHIVTAQNIVPVLRVALATDDVRTRLDAVSTQLTTADLVAFAGQDRQLAAAIAHDWLVEHRILTP